jgi:transposase-like protein
MGKFELKNTISCPNCSCSKYWKIRRGGLLCVNCRSEYRPLPPPVRLSRNQWKSIVRWFVLEQSVSIISEQSGISRYKVMKALQHIRKLMHSQAPDVFQGEVEVDATLYCRAINRPIKKAARTKKENISDSVIFGALCRGGFVKARLVSGYQIEIFKDLLKEWVEPGSIIYSSSVKYFPDFESIGFRHMPIKLQKSVQQDKGNHINGIKGFWGYLRNKLLSRGGIRRKRAYLYLSEYVWRYNNRGKSTKEKIHAILILIKDSTNI